MFSLKRSRVWGLFRFCGQNQHRRKIALHLRFEDTVHRRHHHRVDEAADDLLRLASVTLDLEGVQEALDLAAIDLRQARMQQGRRYIVSAGCHLGLEIGLAPTQAVEFVGDERSIDALEDGGLEPLDARGHVAELCLSLVP
ncbi:hypothetical protein [uncultured Sphingomonas sp.]|uniref:hypothetical protein n=1 Tax=uncultured Sphingomonas sp. TaxID=158754 RepID=UPI0025E79B40|nr:hypothetical protein [uncultured Sphingomonas sp.]